MKTITTFKIRLVAALAGSCLYLGMEASAMAEVPPLLAKPATSVASSQPPKTSAAKTKTSAKTASKTQSTTKNTASSTKSKSKTVASNKKSSRKTAAKKNSNRVITNTYRGNPGVTPIAANHFTPAKPSLFLTINGKTIPYQRFFYNLLPKQQLDLSVSNSSEAYDLTIDGQLIPGNNQQWQWRGPDKPGLHQLELVEKLTHKTLSVTLFVMAPLKSNFDRVHGFTVGNYPPPKDGKVEYQAPKGLVQVTPENAKLFISPHFQLGQFICKQTDGYPQYVSVQPELIEKLELLLEAVNQRGFRLDTFEVMSGFRTPFYNKLIRNVIHSRHIYGSAADIFIDVKPQDGVMDDLNGDGKFNKQDAAYLYDLADNISRSHPNLAGGVGQYSGNSAHGPFVHVDVRGSDARWGM